MEQLLFANLGITGLWDVEYRIYDYYGVPLTAWSGTGVEESPTSEGVYEIFTPVSSLAYFIRWRSVAGSKQAAYQICRTTPKIVRNGLEVIDADTFSMEWDTRNHLNGPALIEAFALGSDGLWARDAVNVNIENDLNNNIQAKEFPLSINRSNYKITKALFGIQAGSLSTNSLRKKWMQIGFRTEGEALPEGFTDEQALEWWEQFKQIPWEEGPMWKAVSGKLVATKNYREANIAQFGATAELGTAQKELFFGVLITPQDMFTGIRLAADQILKVRQHEDGILTIYTKNPLKIYRYSIATGITLVKDISTLGFTGVTDAAIIDDKIYLAQDNQLVVIDTTLGDSSLTILPRGESRNVTHIEKSAEQGLVFYEGADSLAMYATFDMRKLWDIPFVPDKIFVEPGSIILTKANKLYISQGTERTWSYPTVVPFSETADNFPGDIVFVSENAVLLDSGEIFIRTATTDTFELQATVPGTYSPVSFALARIGEQEKRPFVGVDTGLLEMNMDLSWNDNRPIEVPEISSGNIVSPTFMYQLEKELTHAVIENGEVITPATYDSRLIILTDAPDGTGDALLVVFQKAPLSEEDGALTVSKVSKSTAFPLEVLRIEDRIIGQDNEDDASGVDLQSEVITANGETLFAVNDVVETPSTGEF